MKICIDLDGVVCELRRPEQSYRDLQPKPGAVERIRQLREAGHYIILATARHMKTCQGNVGLVVARQGLTTLEWLHRHAVEFDEIHFGKPHADLYIDDNALKFKSWDQIAVNALPVSTEERLRQPASVAPRLATAIMPLAGKGSRFAGSRFVDTAGNPPKPLIDVAGRPMVWWALRSLSGLHIEKIVFVVLQSHVDEHDIVSRIRATLEDLRNTQSVCIEKVQCAVQNGPLPGMLCSVLEARREIDPAGDLLILGADTYVRSHLPENLTASGANISGLISTAHLPGNRWSFAKTDATGRVTEVQEKVRISPHACTGMYYFRSAGEFLRCADEVMASKTTVNGEYYVMPVFERLLRRSDVRLSHSHAVWDMGTPEALSDFLSHLRDSLGG